MKIFFSEIDKENLCSEQGIEFTNSLNENKVLKIGIDNQSTKTKCKIWKGSLKAILDWKWPANKQSM